MTQVDELLTVQEVAQMYHVDETTVRRYVKQGLLEAVAMPHIGKRTVCRIKRASVDYWLGSVTRRAQVRADRRVHTEQEEAQ